MIESIKKYFEACPIFSDGKINVNYLGNGDACYSIDNVPAEPIVKKYCDGATLRQFVFVLAIRDIYNESIARNLKNAQIFEELEKWVLRKNSEGVFPDTDEDCEPIGIEVTKGGCLYDSNIQTGRMQVEMRFVYLKK